MSSILEKPSEKCSYCCDSFCSKPTTLEVSERKQLLESGSRHIERRGEKKEAAKAEN